MSLRRILVWLGGIALLGAAAIDTLAVLGRLVDLPLRGSIELIQPAILLAGGLGILWATITGSHARVHLLVSRLRGSRARVFNRFNELVTIVFLMLVLAGSAWLMADLWGSFELSEIGGVPWRWMRLVANALLLAAAVAALIRLVRPPAHAPADPGVEPGE